MAKDDNSPANAGNTEPTSVKRRLRTPPETMRERTVKLQNQKDKPVSAHRSIAGSIWKGFTWPLRALGHQIAKLQRFKFFRVIGYILVPRYFRNSWKELKLVTWPDLRTSWRLTYAVLIFALIFGAVVAFLDFGLDKLFKEIFTK